MCLDISDELVGKALQKSICKKKSQRRWAGEFSVKQRGNNGELDQETKPGSGFLKGRRLLGNIWCFLPPSETHSIWCNILLLTFYTKTQNIAGYELSFLATY